MRQEDLAGAVGATVRTVSRWETDATKPTRSCLKRIAAALGKSPAWFLGGEDQQVVTATVQGNTIQGAPAEVAEVLRRVQAGDPDTISRHRATAWPGVQALLANPTLCEALAVTAEDRLLLESVALLPVGPATVDQAIELLRALRAQAGRRG